MASRPGLVPVLAPEQDFGVQDFDAVKYDIDRLLPWMRAPDHQSMAEQAKGFKMLVAAVSEGETSERNLAAAKVDSLGGLAHAVDALLAFARNGRDGFDSRMVHLIITLMQKVLRRLRSGSHAIEACGMPVEGVWALLGVLAQLSGDVIHQALQCCLELVLSAVHRRAFVNQVHVLVHAIQQWGLPSLPLPSATTSSWVTLLEWLLDTDRESVLLLWTAGVEAVLLDAAVAHAGDGDVIAGILKCLQFFWARGLGLNSGNVRFLLRAIEEHGRSERLASLACTFFSSLVESALPLALTSMQGILQAISALMGAEPIVAQVQSQCCSILADLAQISCRLNANTPDIQSFFLLGWPTLLAQAREACFAFPHNAVIQTQAKRLRSFLPPVQPCAL